jgi:UDP-glucose 4-epimerase
VLIHTALRHVPEIGVGVLGAGGFVGRHLMERLRVEGIAATPVSLRLGSGEENAASDSSALRDRLRDLDALVVLAGVPPDRDRTHTLLTANAALVGSLCDAMADAKPRHVVYLSSDAVYPTAAEEISESTCADPSTLYGVSHRVRECLLEDVCGDRLLRVRSTMVYGAGDTHDAYGPNRMCRQAVEEGRIDVFGEGEDIRDYLEVADLTDLLARALLNRTVGVVNAASGESVSALALARAIEDRTGADIRYVPRRQPATTRRFAVAALRAGFPECAPTPLAVGLDWLIAARRSSSPSSLR